MDLPQNSAYANTSLLYVFQILTTASQRFSFLLVVLTIMLNDTAWSHRGCRFFTIEGIAYCAIIQNISTIHSQINPNTIFNINII